MAALRGKSRGQRFRFSLPNESDIDVHEHIQCSTPFIFGTNETSGRAEPVNRVNRENDDVELEGRQLQTVSDDTSRKRKSKKTPSVKKWKWKDEQIEVLLSYIKDYKTTCDFNGIDFEADLQAMYTELRRCMASTYPGEFGPQYLTDPKTGVKDMSAVEYASYKKSNEEEKVQITRGYDRMKQKVKGIRQDYRTAVNKGTRSGSGKIVKEHFDILCSIWGGSPATTMLDEGVDGDIIRESLLTDPDDISTYGSTNEGAESCAQTDNEQTDDFERSSGSTSDNETNMTKRAKISVSKIPQLVDNKRKHMEKTLSQAKRDQILMNASKEDLIMKKEMISAFEQSNKALENTMVKMTDSLSSMAEGISDGMKMIAMAMTSTSQQMQPSTHQFQPMSFQSFRSADHMGTYGTQRPGIHPYDQVYGSVMHQPGVSDQEQGDYVPMTPIRRYQESNRSYTPSPNPSDQCSVHSEGGSDGSSGAIYTA